MFSLRVTTQLHSYKHDLLKVRAKHLLHEDIHAYMYALHVHIKTPQSEDNV